MLRLVIIAYGLLCLLGAVVLFFVAHVTLLLVLYLAVNGLIVVGAMFFERKRYHARVNRTDGYWQATGERFIDPTTSQLMEVYYNPTTGERDYRKA